MNHDAFFFGCCGPDHFNRRTLLKSAALSGLSWLTPLAEALSRAQEHAPRGAPAKSLIVLWLQGGPSQLETFDPHPGSKIAGGSQARKTAVPAVQLAKGFEQLADLMDSVSLVRSVVSKEGDHERATYNVKTGFRPDPTLVHPSIGAVVCHQLKDNIEIPRHVSILPGQWPARGGYVGDQFDAFKTGDPIGPIPDVVKRVPDPRFQHRIDDLTNVVEAEFARGRLRELDSSKTLHRTSTTAALRMMSSEQLQAFNVKQAPQSLRDQFGDTPFGRGCLAAARLIEVGVRCVEVTLDGWDSHVNNHEIQAGRVATLDPAFAALLRDLKSRELLDQTLVICGGEFGRTPRINPAGGRDHWPHGFSMALAGGGIRGGRVIGQTAIEPTSDAKNPQKDVKDPHNVADIHATILHALGINFRRELDTPVGRPMKISEGEVIAELVA
jgi:uncharacterized protein (DUF1501 family)